MAILINVFLIFNIFIGLIETMKHKGKKE